MTGLEFTILKLTTRKIEPQGEMLQSSQVTPEFSFYLEINNILLTTYWQFKSFIKIRDMVFENSSISKKRYSGKSLAHSSSLV